MAITDYPFLLPRALLAHQDAGEQDQLTGRELRRRLKVLNAMQLRSRAEMTTRRLSGGARAEHQAEQPLPEETSTPLCPVLVQQVEGLDANAPVALLRTIIEHNKLPVSPGTGGAKRRTKSHMLQDIQVAVDHAGWGQAMCLLATTLTLLAVVHNRAPNGGRLYGPVITAGDAAVLSAQGVLSLCKEDTERCTAAREHFFRLTPTQRLKLGSLVEWYDDDWSETTPSPAGRVWPPAEPMNEPLQQHEQQWSKS